MSRSSSAASVTHMSQPLPPFARMVSVALSRFRGTAAFLAAVTASR
jgi:hypothetical protein